MAAVLAVVALVAGTVLATVGVVTPRASAGPGPAAVDQIRPVAAAGGTSSGGGSAGSKSGVDEKCGCAGADVKYTEFGPALGNPELVTYTGKKPNNGYSPHKKYRATFGDDRATVTRLSDGVTVLTVTLPSDFGGLAFSPDDDRFLLYTFESFTLYDLTTGKEIYFDPAGVVVGFSPRNTYLAIDDVLNGALQVLDVTTGKLVTFDGGDEIPGPVTLGFAQQDTLLLVWTDPVAGPNPKQGHATLYGMPDGTIDWQSSYFALPAFDFSPHSTYLEQKTVTYPNNVDVAVYATADGSAVYHAQYQFYIPPDTGGAGGGSSSHASSTTSSGGTGSTSTGFAATSTTPTSTSISTGSSTMTTGSTGASTSGTASTTGSGTRSTSCPAPTTAGSSTTGVTQTSSSSSDLGASSRSSTSSGSSSSSTGSPSTPVSSSVAPSSTAKPCGGSKNHGPRSSKSPTEDLSGFGPDDSVWIDDHLADDTSNRLLVANLTTGKQIVDDPIPRVTTLLFSPCGDTLVVLQEISPIDVDRYYADLYNSATGASLSGGHLTVSQAATFRATDHSQVVDDGGTVTTVSPNLLCPTLSLVGGATILGGDARDYTVKLSHPAPLGGLTFAVTSGSPSFVPQASITIAAAHTEVNLHVTTLAPAADTPATLTFALPHAAAGYNAKGAYQIMQVTTTWTVTETVQADPVTNLFLRPEEVYGTDTPVTATVRVDKPAPASGLTITLASDTDAVTVPGSVTIPAGQFQADTALTIAAVPSDTTATITATGPAGQATAQMLVHSPVASDLSITWSPSGSAPAGTPVTLTATIASTGPTPTGTLRVGDLVGGHATDEGSHALRPVDTGNGDGTRSSATASVTLTGLAAGRHTITVDYGGDTAHRGVHGDATISVVGVDLTWTGHGDGTTFSDPANWDKDTVPSSGDTLAIARDSALSVTDDIAGLAIKDLFLTGPVHLTGAAFTLQQGITAAGTDAEIDNAIELTSGSHQLATQYGLTMAGKISGGGALHLTSSGGVGAGSPSGTLLGTTVLSAPNTYSGGTSIGDATEPGRAELAAGGTLGGSGPGAVALYGILCLDPGSSQTLPIVSHHGEIDGPPGCSAATGENRRGPAFDGSPQLAGPIDDEGGLSLGCAASAADGAGPRDPGEASLVISGAIRGPGGLSVCPFGAVDDTGPDPNTYRGPTMIRGTLISDAKVHGVLVLDKPDGVISLPGTVNPTAGRDGSGPDDTGVLMLQADGQIASGSSIRISELYLGTHRAVVGELHATRVQVVVDGAHHGRIDVAGEADLQAAAGSPGGGAVTVTAQNDPAVPTPLTVVTGSPVDRCDSGTVLTGSARVAYREACDSTTVTLDPIWQTGASITIDPDWGTDPAGSVTVTAQITSPPTAPTASGQAQLEVYRYYGNYSAPCGYQYRQWCPTGASVSAAIDPSGTATFRLPATSLPPVAALGVSYPGDSLHTPSGSPLRRYLVWPAGDPVGPVGAPTLTHTIIEDTAIEPFWNQPANPGGTGILGYQITATPPSGPAIVADTNHLAPLDDEFIGRQDFPVYITGTVAGLSPGTTYTVTVAAVTHAGVGPASNAVTVTTSGGAPTATAPGPPTGVKAATREPGQVMVTWTAPANSGGSPVTGYLVTPYRAGTAQPAVSVADPTARSLIVTGLAGGSVYTFTVAAVNAVGVGAESDPSGPVTPTSTAPPSAAPPGAPTGVTGAPGGPPGTVTLAWVPPADDGGAAIDHYVVTAHGPGADRTIATADATAGCTVTGLTGGVAYTFTVAAVNAAGKQGPDSSASAPITPAEPLPGRPTALTATPTPGGAFLSWSAPADDGGFPIVGYLIAGTAGGAPLAPITVTGAQTTATVGDLQAGTSYTFTVAAVTVAGTGPASDPSPPVVPQRPTAVTAVPGPPTAVTATVKARDYDYQHAPTVHIALGWGAPARDGGAPVTGYQITGTVVERFDRPDGTVEVQHHTHGWQAAAGATSLAVSLDGVTPLWLGNGWWQVPRWTSAEVSFVVRASNSLGAGVKSAPSVAVSLTWDPPDPPWYRPTMTCPYGGEPPLCSVFPPGTRDGSADNKPGGPAQPGSDLDLLGDGYDAGEQVQVWLHSTAILLGSAAADTAGVLRVRVTLPAGVPDGQHTIELIGQRSGHEIDVPLTVAARASGGATPSTRSGSAATTPPATTSASATSGRSQQMVPTGSERHTAMPVTRTAQPEPLASTGTDSEAALLAAAALLVSGLALLVAGRRRRGRHG